MTQALRAVLAVSREKCRDQMEDGMLLKSTAYETQLEMAHMAGFIDCLKKMQEIDYETFLSALGD